MNLRQIKYDLLSASLSFSIHLLILFLIGFSSKFSVRSYDVVELDAFSIETSVRSSVVSTVSNLGNDRPSSERGKTEVPSGRSVKFSRSAPAGSSPAKRGELPSSTVPRSGRASQLSRGVSSRLKGDVLADLSITEGRSGNGKVHLNVKSQYDRLASYIIGVRRRIASKWHNPYRGSSVKRKLVILKFDLMKDGSIRNFTVERLSDDTLFNRSAIGAVYSSQPFPEIPFDVDRVRLRVKFEVE